LLDCFLLGVPQVRLADGGKYLINNPDEILKVAAMKEFKTERAPHEDLVSIAVVPDKFLFHVEVRNLHPSLVYRRRERCTNCARCLQSTGALKPHDVVASALDVLLHKMSDLKARCSEMSSAAAGLRAHDSRDIGGAPELDHGVGGSWGAF